MSLRGRPSRSIALAATISACVESRPPLTPMTTFGLADRVAAAAPARRPGCCRPRSSPGRAARRRRARTGSGRPCGAARCRRSGGLELELDGAELVVAACAAAVVVEGALPQPLLAQPVEVDVDDRARGGPSGNRSVSAEQVAALVDHRLAVPGQVGASTRPGPRPRRGTPRCSVRSRLRTSSRRSSARRDGDRAAGEVGQHGRAGQRGLGARRDRHPHVLADLDVQHAARARRSAAKSRSGPNGTSLAAEP